MPNIASVLKQEVARIARKEARGDTAKLKKASAQHRAEIAALKRQVADLGRQLADTNRAFRKMAATAAGNGSAAASRNGSGLNGNGNGAALKLSGKGLASLRRRLGLSAADMGLLVGASGQTIYNWEAKRPTPRGSQIDALLALKAMRKRDVAIVLTPLKEQAAQ